MLKSTGTRWRSITPRQSSTVLISPVPAHSCTITSRRSDFPTSPESVVRHLTPTGLRQRIRLQRRFCDCSKMALPVRLVSLGLQPCSAASPHFLGPPAVVLQLQNMLH